MQICALTATKPENGTCQETMQLVGYTRLPPLPNGTMPVLIQHCDRLFFLVKGSNVGGYAHYAELQVVQLKGAIYRRPPVEGEP